MNHLNSETSPYLLQHVKNPVDWYPWKKFSFEKAEKEKKPIFLSIGYSTCHWCHVMAHESFENQEVADYLNKHFVSIKVDREERPDVDQLYMQFLLTQTGSGGWPMSIWLTDKKVPFYGATYIPMWPSNEKRKTPTPSFLDVLKRIHELWENPEFRKELELDNTFQFLQRLLCQEYYEQSDEQPIPGLAAPQPTTSTSFETMATTIPLIYGKYTNDLITQKKYYDELNGGFSGKSGPKFPSYSLFKILIDSCACETEKPKFNNFIGPILNSFRKICFGGIYDQIGGGFHRYSVDRWWHVPHFEKMLYNQAQNVDALMDTCALMRDQRYIKQKNSEQTFHFFNKKIVETLDYVARDLVIKPENNCTGFLAGEDADSKYVAPEIDENTLKRTGNMIEQEHMEGGFYCWTKPELELALQEAGHSKNEIDEFCKLFSVQETTNIRYESDPRAELRSEKFNVLAISELEWSILENSVNAEEAHKKIAKIEEMKLSLFKYRNKNRPRPGLDTKTILSWNAMMTSTFIRASLYFKFLKNHEKSKQYLKISEENVEFLMKYLKIPDKIVQNQKDLKDLNIKNVFIHSRCLPNEEKVKGKIGFDPNDEIILFCEDYAEILKMFLNLYEATSNFEYLKKSVEISSDIFKLFWDDAKGGFFENKISETSPILSKKTEDSTLLSSNAVVFESMLRLGRILHWFDDNELTKNFIEKQYSFMSYQIEKITAMAVGSLNTFYNNLMAQKENFKEFLVVFDSTKPDHLEKLEKFQIEVLGSLETWLFPFQRSIFFYDVSKSKETLEIVSDSSLNKWKSDSFLKILESCKDRKDFFVQKCENQKCDIIKI